MDEPHSGHSSAFLYALALYECLFTGWVRVNHAILRYVARRYGVASIYVFLNERVLRKDRLQVEHDKAQANAYRAILECFSTSLQVRCFRSLPGLEERRTALAYGPAMAVRYLAEKRAVRRIYRFCRSWAFYKRRRPKGFVWDGSCNRYYGGCLTMRAMYGRAARSNGSVLIWRTQLSAAHDLMYMGILFNPISLALQLSLVPVLLVEVLVMLARAGHNA